MTEPVLDEQPLSAAGDVPRAYDARGLVVDTVVVLGAMLGLGMVAGILWAALADPPQYLRFDAGPGQDELGLSRVFGVTGWYVGVGCAVAILGGLVLGFVRTRDPLTTLVMLVVGSLMAAMVMQYVGYQLGPDDPTAFLLGAEPGTRAEGQLQLDPVHFRQLGLNLTLAVAYLAWPIGSLAGLLVSLLTRAE